MLTFAVGEIANAESDGVIEVTATVPPNTRARVSLPDGSDAFDVGSGQHQWTVKDLRTPSQ